MVVEEDIGVIFRLSPSCRAGLPAALSGEMPASEFASLFSATTSTSAFEPNGYTALSQRIAQWTASTKSNYSDHCHDNNYVCTIHHQDVRPAGCMSHQQSWESGNNRSGD